MKKIIVIIVSAALFIVTTLYMYNSKDHGPIVNEKISTNVEMYDSEGNEITVYEMDEEEYKKTDFRKNKEN